MRNNNSDSLICFYSLFYSIFDFHIIFTCTIQVSGKLIRKCALGTELVDWLMNLSVIVHTRTQAAGMWQAILEEGVLSHGQ